MKKILLSILLGFSLISVTSPSYKVHAEVSTDTLNGYTDVISDLKKMKIDYSSYYDDTTSSFITLNQGYNTNNELETFIYVNYIEEYEGLYAQISTEIASNLDDITEDYEIYDLKLVSSDKSSNLKKYEIIGLDNFDQTTRRYRISSVAVEYDGGSTSLTRNIEGTNLTYLFNGLDNKSLKGIHTAEEFITITDKQLVNYRYGDTLDLFGIETGSMNWNDDYTDAWYLFFNTDKQIDYLLEVEIIYTQYDFNITYSTAAIPPSINTSFTEDYLLERHPDNIEYLESEPKRITPGKNKVEYFDNKFFGLGKKYYKELEAIMDMKSHQQQDDDAFIFTEFADKYDWGINFLNTPISCWIDKDVVTGTSLEFSKVKGSGVCDAAILRLKFETNGEIYNLYTIDTPTSDFDTESADPTDDSTDFSNLIDKLINNMNNGFNVFTLIIQIMGIVLGIIVIVVLIILILKSFPIHEWIAGLLTLPFDKSKKKKRKQK